VNRKVIMGISTADPQQDDVRVRHYLAIWVASVHRKAKSAFDLPFAVPTLRRQEISTTQPPSSISRRSNDASRVTLLMPANLPLGSSAGGKNAGLIALDVAPSKAETSAY
jgi:hypothetical protein